MENHTARRTTMRASEAGQGDGVDRQHRRRDGGATIQTMFCQTTRYQALVRINLHFIISYW